MNDNPDSGTLILASILWRRIAGGVLKLRNSPAEHAYQEKFADLIK
jgi:hypothetical protein